MMNMFRNTKTLNILIKSAYLKSKIMLNQEEQQKLLNICKQTVEEYIKNNNILDWQIDDQNLNAHMGAFVSIYNKKELRGCVGMIKPQKPLWQTICDIAIAAATEDNRFISIQKDELIDLTYEINVLSVPKKINNWQDIILGIHGVIIKKGFRSGVFLPGVAADTGWGLEEFLSQLCYQKADLPPDAYKNDPEVEISIFTTQIIK